MTGEILLGTVRRTPISLMADKAAQVIAKAGEPLAVTRWPCGRCWLEPVGEAAEDDIVGVYHGERPFTLLRQIHDDLRFVTRGGA